MHAVELDARKVYCKVRVLVVVVLGREAKGKGGLDERGARKVVVYPVVEYVLHAAVGSGHGLGEVKGEVILAVEVLHEVGAKVGRERCSSLARGCPAVERILHDDGVLVAKVVIADEFNAVKRVV